MAGRRLGIPRGGERGIPPPPGPPMHPCPALTHTYTQPAGCPHTHAPHVRFSAPGTASVWPLLERTPPPPPPNPCAPLRTPSEGGKGGIGRCRGAGGGAASPSPTYAASGRAVPQSTAAGPEPVPPVVAHHRAYVGGGGQRHKERERGGGEGVRERVCVSERINGHCTAPLPFGGGGVPGVCRPPGMHGVCHSLATTSTGP